MSTTVIVHFAVRDVGEARMSLAKNASLVEEISKEAQELGAKHHHFFEGDGELVAVDEWEDRAAFDSFFKGNNNIATVTSEAGVDSPPRVEFLDRFDAPGVF